MSQLASIRHPESCPHLTMVLSLKALPKGTAHNGQTALVIHLPGAPLCHMRKKSKCRTSHFCDKILDKNKSREKTVKGQSHCLRAWSIMAGKAWQQGHEAPGHGTSTARMWRDEPWSSVHFFLFIPSRIPPHGMALPTFNVCLRQVNQSRNPLTDTLRGFFPHESKFHPAVNQG